MIINYGKSNAMCWLTLGIKIGNIDFEKFIYFWVYSFDYIGGRKNKKGKIHRQKGGKTKNNSLTVRNIIPANNEWNLHNKKKVLYRPMRNSLLVFSLNYVRKLLSIVPRL